MTKRQAMEHEAMHLIQRATPETISLLLKLLQLGTSSPGFMKAFAAATQPGEDVPPVDVVKALVSEWVEKEGLG